MAGITTDVQTKGTDTKSRWQKLADEYEAIYSAQTARNNAAATAEAEKTLRSIEEQIAALSAQYAQTNKELYREKRAGERDLAQQLAAQGYTGGMNESSRVRLEAGYEEALAQNERERLQGIASIRNGGQEQAYQRERERVEANQKAEDDYRERLRSIEDKQYSETAKHAEALAAVGDFSGYRALGYSEEEIEKLYRGWAAKNAKLAKKLYG